MHTHIYICECEKLLQSTEICMSVYMTMCVYVHTLTQHIHRAPNIMNASLPVPTLGTPIHCSLYYSIIVFLIIK